MPEQVHCPSCEAMLRVPDTLLGKNVKCPKCQTTFIAEMEESAPPETITRERKPSRGSPPPNEDEDEYEESPLEEEEDRPRRKRRRRRVSVDVESLVSGPANALLAVGIIDIVLGALNLLLRLLGVSVLAMGGGGGAAARNADQQMIGLAIGVIFGVGSLGMGTLITMGAMRMKNLSSYGLAMTACILAMIPCVNCCILGLPFGIWGLTVLNKPEVKDAFK